MAAGGLVFEGLRREVRVKVFVEREIANKQEQREGLGKMPKIPEKLWRSRTKGRVTQIHELETELSSLRDRLRSALLELTNAQRYYGESVKAVQNLDQTVLVQAEMNDPEGKSMQVFELADWLKTESTQRQLAPSVESNKWEQTGDFQAWYATIGGRKVVEGVRSIIYSRESEQENLQREKRAEAGELEVIVDQWQKGRFLDYNLDEAKFVLSAGQRVKKTEFGEEKEVLHTNLDVLAEDAVEQMSSLIRQDYSYGSFPETTFSIASDGTVTAVIENQSPEQYNRYGRAPWKENLWTEYSTLASNSEKLKTDLLVKIHTKLRKEMGRGGRDVPARQDSMKGVTIEFAEGR